jgi:hypothetical protein
MFTRKLGRFLGLVFIVAAAFGGVGAATGAGHHSATPAAVEFSTLTIVWE